MPNADGSPSVGEPGYSAPGGLIQAAGAPVSPDKTVTGYNATTASPTQATSTGYTPTGTVVADDQTVAGNLNKIISDDSPLMRQARTRANQDANSKGLLNSSMAVGAGQNAVIQQALPIAQQDASTRYNANTKTVDAQNAEANFAAQAGNQASLANASLGTDVSKTNAGMINAASAQTSQAANQLQLGYLNKDTQIQLGQLSSDTQKTLTTLTTQNQQLLQTNSSAATMFSNVVTALANIAGSNTMSQEAKDAATSTQINMLNQGLQQLSNVSSTAPAHVSGLNLSQYFTPTNTPAAGTPTFPGANGQTYPTQAAADASMPPQALNYIPGTPVPGGHLVAPGTPGAQWMDGGPDIPPGGAWVVADSGVYSGG